MKIVAFDPSTTHVGWCVAENNAYTGSGVFVPKGNVEKRMEAIFWWLLESLKKTQPDVIAFEEPMGDHGNRRTDRQLGNVGGLVLAAGYLTGVKRFIRVYPMAVKATKVSKDNLAYAAAAAGKEVGPDEADAIGVWLAGEKILQEARIKQEVRRAKRNQ